MSDRPQRRVTFYFDFVSPYSYLALTQAGVFAAAYRVDWRLRPVVYGVLLDESGLVGPVETPTKRAYTIRDVVRSARLLDVPLAGPPRHPFRSLEALRTLCLVQDEPGALRLALRIARSAWGEGRDVTDLAVLAGIVGEESGDGDLGELERLDDDEELQRRLADPQVKDRLRRNTDEALAAGVFGVPTFVHGGETFWGHDRLPHLGAWLAGHLPAAGELEEEIASRPRGAERRGSPWGG